MCLATTSQATFYREFLMTRSDFQPQDFGVDQSKVDFQDEMVNQFNDFIRGEMSLDEMLLRPDLAKSFCMSVRGRLGYHDVPDDIILRSIMSRRKNPR